MLKRTKTLFGAEARQKLFIGMETVYKAVASTLGSRGRNAVYRRWENPLITNDGVSIARQILPEDDVERMGADLIKEAAERTNENAGDGTTTATILAYSLIKYGQDFLDAHSEYSPMQLRNELDHSLKDALKLLSERAVLIKDDAELLKIAKISSENEDIAKLVALSVREAGETGRVVVEESQGIRIEKEKIEGMEIEGGYMSPYFVTNPERQESVLDNAYVLVSDKTFSVNKDILPLCEELFKAGGTGLVIVGKDIQGEALANMVMNNSRMKGRFLAIGVKAPRKVDFLEDLAVFCGRKEAVTGERSVRGLSMNDCVRVRKVVASKDKTLFVKGDRTDTEKSYHNVRVEELKTVLREAKGDEKRHTEDRLARITGSVVVIKVGAESDAEIPYLRMKIEDAVFAVKAAIAEGYVAGGGITLRDIGRQIHNTVGNGGSEVLMKACDMPSALLVTNSGAVVDNTKFNQHDGFDTDSGEYKKDLVGRGIIDPVLVEKQGLQNSVHLAGMFLTIATVITDIPYKTDGL
jgi:chaperonin GroEL